MEKSFCKTAFVALLFSVLLLAGSPLSVVAQAGEKPMISQGLDMNMRGHQGKIDATVSCNSAYDCRLTGCRAPQCVNHVCTCPGAPLSVVAQAGEKPMISQGLDMNMRGHEEKIDTTVACNSAYDCRLTGCVAPVCVNHVCTCPGAPSNMTAAEQDVELHSVNMQSGPPSSNLVFWPLFSVIFTILLSQPIRGAASN